jgi:hypothetical protein
MLAALNSAFGNLPSASFSLVVRLTETRRFLSADVADEKPQDVIVVPSTHARSYPSDRIPSSICVHLRHLRTVYSGSNPVMVYASHRDAMPCRESGP